MPVQSAQCLVDVGGPMGVHDMVSSLVLDTAPMLAGPLEHRSCRVATCHTAPHCMLLLNSSFHRLPVQRGLIPSAYLLYSIYFI